MDSKLFGHKLKELRNEAKMGSRELSRLVGKTDTYVSQVERGQIKKPDFKTSYVLLKCIGLDEGKILELLDSYGIRFSTTLEYKEAKSFFIPSNSTIKNQVDWFNEDSDELKDQVHCICETLNNFAEKDLTRAKAVIGNLFHLITTDKQNFDFFCQLLSCDFTQISTSKKARIVSKMRELTAKDDKNGLPE